MENNRTRVSIIIPIYNVEDYLHSCLASVASQTMTEGLECILVDDCSSDKSVKIAEAFISIYTGPIVFRLLHQPYNSGPSAARNKGIINAAGDYLFFLDSDDVISNGSIKSLYNLTSQHPGIDLVQGTYFDDPKNSFIHFPPYTNNRRIIKQCLLTYTGKNLVPHNRLIRRELVIGNKIFFHEGIIHEDNLWVFYLAKYVTSMACSATPTYHHRYNPNSITGNVNVQKATFSYRIVINESCQNIDPFLPGCQKELILNTLATVLYAHYYKSNEDKMELIDTFARQNTLLERILLRVYFRMPQYAVKAKLMHLLIRLYKLND